MLRIVNAGRAGVAGAAIVLACVGVAAAQVSTTTVRSGEIHLPASGLVIDVPARANTEYRVSGSWSFVPETEFFDARDTVDEFDTATGQLSFGNRILSGYFSAGDCAAVLADENLDASWTREADLWGHRWSVKGGVFTFDGALGRTPTAILCTTNAKGQSLLLFRFLTNQPDTLGADAIMESARNAAVLQSAWTAWRDGKARESHPLRRPDMRARADSVAARRVTLPVSGLVADLPDDGYFWLVEQEDGDTDMLYRLLPTLPEVTVDVVPFAYETCAEILPELPNNRPGHRVTDLPAGWVAGPTILVSGESEITMCRDVDYGSLVVGVFQGDTQTSVAALHPLLTALAAARPPS